MRVRLSLTSLGGGDRASPCAAVAALRPTRTASRGPGAERPRRRRELRSEPGAGPACQRRGRPLAAVAAAPFCSSSSLLPAAHSAPTLGNREARHGRLLHPLPGQPVFSAPPAPLALGTPHPSWPPVPQLVPSEGGREARRGRERGRGPGARPRTARAPLHPGAVLPASAGADRGGPRGTVASREAGRRARRFQGQPRGQRGRRS